MKGNVLLACYPHIRAESKMNRRRIINISLVGIIFFAAIAAVIPTGDSRGPDTRYWNYGEIISALETWEAQYPDIFHREIIGYSGIDGHPIWAVKISDNASLHEAEKRLIFDAAIHANEANGPGAIMYMIDKLLTNYGSSGYYTNFINNLEMWFVPVVNVDGYEIVFEGGTNWADWRKSKRDNNGDKSYSYPIDGVDCNRNWDYRWDEYQGTSYSDSRYKGPYPFSENCVVAIRDLIMRENPVFLMDFHSPDVPSIGNKIWWPWYDNNGGGYGVDRAAFEPISDALGNRCQTETGGWVNGYGPAFNEIPKEQCWVYKNTGICALLMEISRQFWWTGATVDTIAARTGRGNFYLMERALSGSGLTGTVTDAMSGAPLLAQVRVNQVHDASVGPRMTEQFHGHYARLLQPGSYSVTFSAEDHQTQTLSVYLGSSSWTTLNVLLQPDPADVDIDEQIAESILWVDSMKGYGGSVHYRMVEQDEISLDVFDMSGRFVMNLAEGMKSPGVRSVPLSMSLGSGSYMLRLGASDWEVVRKFIVLR